MGLNEIVRSKSYKNFMSKLYGFGAAIVIIGALFKINHFPLAGEMLIVGMGIEAIIFIFSAFEPLHEEVDWSLVYPELAGLEGEGILSQGIARKARVGSESEDLLSEKLDLFLANAQITPEVFNRLSTGLNNLAITTESLGHTADIVGANNKYTDELHKMTGQLDQINQMYSSQMKASVAQMETTAKLQDNMHQILENLNGSLDDSKRYRSDISDLSRKVSELNDMYSKMLAAMGKN